ncbi:MAG: NADH-quinone oxidoreductase subunit A [Verrucomicrobia bacterium]|nr:NADH-quinone oxidoreductase subunit A [Verrucomicrobiota bacterium]
MRQARDIANGFLALRRNKSTLAKAGTHFYRRRVDAQLNQYLPVLLLGLVALLFAAGTLVASVVVGRIFNKKIAARTTPTKDIAYECGMLPVGEGSARLSVKFYLVAMLFILFDIEVVFLYPWAIVYRELLKRPDTAGLALISMLTFIAILFVGYLYALKKRAFDWKS